MAYTVRIERIGAYKKISEEEWISAVDSTPFARRATDDRVSATHPPTGVEIVIPSSLHDVEVELDGEWVRGIFWRDGTAMFSPSEADWTPNARFRSVVHELANKVDAQIVGDEGELYTEDDAGAATGEVGAASISARLRRWLSGRNAK